MDGVGNISDGATKYMHKYPCSHFFAMCLVALRVKKYVVTLCANPHGGVLSTCGVRKAEMNHHYTILSGIHTVSGAHKRREAVPTPESAYSI